MDYLHAQRFLSDLLLKHPSHPGIKAKAKHSVFQFLLKMDLPTEVTLPSRSSAEPTTPVVGIGLTITEQGKDSLAVLVPHEDFGKPVRQLVAELGMEDLDVTTIISKKPIASVRPAQGGDSIGDPAGVTGTFGLIVKDPAGTEFILSCNHVIAGVNAGRIGKDLVFQPGAPGGGQVKDRIGVLHAFAQITMGGHIGNKIDAALCKPDASSSVCIGIRGLGSLRGYLADPPLKTKVRKMGWKTQITDGKIQIKKLSVLIDYPNKQQALFEDQLGIISSKSGYFSDQGDSGSIVIDDQDRAVGLIISCVSGVDLTIANPIEGILSHFRVSIP
jgi:hypothetical protein